MESCKLGARAKVHGTVGGGGWIVSLEIWKIKVESTNFCTLKMHGANIIPFVIVAFVSLGRMNLT